MPAVRATPEQLRAFWFERQGLAHPSPSSPAEILKRTGWLVTAGAQGAYLSLRARIPDLHRDTVDGAVFADSTIAELPSARGCTMLVPRADASLVLACARRWFARTLALAEAKAGVSAREIDALSEAVTLALAAGALDDEALRAAVPQDLVRSLGEAGRKIGYGSTLPLARSALLVAGVIERRAVGRLDARRFVYTLADRAGSPTPTVWGGSMQSSCVASRSGRVPRRGRRSRGGSASRRARQRRRSTALRSSER